MNDGIQKLHAYQKYIDRVLTCNDFELFKSLPDFTSSHHSTSTESFIESSSLKIEEIKQPK